MQLSPHQVWQCPIENVNGPAKMSVIKESKNALDDPKVNVRIKISALWASVMFCYIYGDYFGLYVPGTVGEMQAGKMGPLGPATQGILVGVAAMMAIPSVMVFLSLVLRPGVNRWLNLALGAIYTAIILMSMPGAWDFYVFLGVVEALLTMLVIWHAWHWPRSANGVG